MEGKQMERQGPHVLRGGPLDGAQFRVLELRRSTEEPWVPRSKTISGGMYVLSDRGDFVYAPPVKAKKPKAKAKKPKA